MTEAQLQFLQGECSSRVVLCVEHGVLLTEGIKHDVAVCLCGLDLPSRLSGGTFIHKLTGGSVHYDASVSMEVWDDDTDDNYGWHDPYFEGDRITIFPGRALPIGAHVHQYGIRTEGCVGYPSPHTVGNVLAALP